MTMEPSSFGIMPLTRFSISLRGPMGSLAKWTTAFRCRKGIHQGREPSSPPPSLTGHEHESTGSSPRTRAANLIGCRGKGISSKPAKRATIDYNLMDALDRLADSSAEIEKLQIEANLTMHRENLADCQENRKLELELFQLVSLNLI